MKPRKPISLPGKAELVAFLFILLVGIFFRTFRIESLPPGLFWDEAGAGVAAKNILSSLSPGEYGLEYWYAWLCAIALYLSGSQAWAIRLVSAMGGIAAIPAVYLLAKELFPCEENGRFRFFPLLSSAVLAILYWHVNLSRLGFMTPFLPLAGILCFYCLWRGLRTGATLPFVWAGLLLGFSQYVYQAAQVLPVLLFSFLFLLFFLDRDLLRTHWRKLALLLAVGLVTAVPGAMLYFKGHVAHMRELSPLQGGNAFSILPSNLLKSLLMFNFQGDFYTYRHNLAGRPALDPFLSAFFLIGVGYALTKWRRPRFLFLLLWLVMLTLPATLSVEPAHFLRASGAIPALVMLTALGLVAFIEEAGRWVQGRDDSLLVKKATLALLIGGTMSRTLVTVSIGTASRAALALLIGGGFLYSTSATYRDYFQVWARAPELFHAFDVGPADVGQYLKGQLTAGSRAYLTPLKTSHMTLRFYLSPGQLERVKGFDGRKYLVLADAADGEVTYVVAHDDRETLPTLVKYFPQGQILRQVVYQPAQSSSRPPRASKERVWYDMDPPGNPVVSFTAYRVPKGATPVIPKPPLAIFGDKVELLGFESGVEKVRAGDPLALTLFWRALARMDRPYSVVVYLLDEGDRVWDRHEAEPGGGLYPTTAWDEDEIVVDRQVIAGRAPIHYTESKYRGRAGVPPGQYRLAIGMALPETMELLPARDSVSGNRLKGDRAILGRVRIE